MLFFGRENKRRQMLIQGKFKELEELISKITEHLNRESDKRILGNNSFYKILEQKLYIVSFFTNDHVTKMSPVPPFVTLLWVKLWSHLEKGNKYEDDENFSKIPQNKRLVCKFLPRFDLSSVQREFSSSSKVFFFN